MVVSTSTTAAASEPAPSTYHPPQKLPPGSAVIDEKTTLAQLPILFQPLTIKDLTLPNRLMVAPMCQYSSQDGLFNDYHLVHLGSFAVHGAGLIMVEMTNVEARGRISPACAGLWSDAHIPGLKRVIDFVHVQGGKIGVQLAHAGRKGSTDSIYDTFPPSAYWNDNVLAPTGGLQWDEKHRVPREITLDEIQQVVQAFGQATVRAAKAGADTIEIHAAHGYLINQFISPITNKRTDDYGGTLEKRARFLLEVIQIVRANFPPEKPIFVRLSGSDCVEHIEGLESLTIDQSVQLARWAKDAGADVIHVSTGGNTADQKVTYSPGYQVPHAAAVKQAVPDAIVVAVGSITSGKQAEQILQSGASDLVACARAFLKSPALALEAGRELGVNVSYSTQYSAAKYV